MQDKLFLIAIGGTGMRCLESFVHLCAAGLFDNQEIEILTLDTDQTNGNKGRVENLIRLYNRVKTNDAGNEGGAPRSNTFFSAKLNLYQFFTDYSTAARQTFSSLSSLPEITDEQREDNEDISDLLFDDNVQQFNLDHGYRAQTHLGSMLMYHGIVEAARNAKKGGDDVKQQERELCAYLQLLNDNSANARVFVFGSIFGGTGASSIPVIPLALSESLRIITGGASQINLQNILFGSTLLTDYFTFNNPNEAQCGQQKVIACANNFALNSQAALSFYNNDPTVQRTYKRMYHIGWPSSAKLNYSGNGDKVITGGQQQCNPCHIAELMCATAAYNFFKDDRGKLSAIGNAEYVFRTVSTDDNGVMLLSGSSFVGPTEGEDFENKLGAFLSFSHVILSKYSGAYDDRNGTSNFLNYLNDASFKLYNEMKEDQCKEIDLYLKEFAYKFVNGNVSFGWIYQVYKSVGNGKFLFSPEAFRTDIKELKNIDPGKIFSDEAHWWNTTGVLGSSSTKRFNTFVENIKDSKSLPDEKQAETLKESFLAHMYNAITISQKYYLNYAE